VDCPGATFTGSRYKSGWGGQSWPQSAILPALGAYWNRGGCGQDYADARYHLPTLSFAAGTAIKENDGWREGLIEKRNYH